VRIFVYEFVTGGGLAGRPVPRSFAREGLAMRSALLEDLAAIDGHEIVMTTDTRFTRRMPPGVDSVPVAGSLQASGASGASETIDALIDASDAVWLIAPETSRCLERLAARVERRGKTLLGSGAAAVRMAADKSRLPRRLARTCIGHPKTTVLARGVSAPAAAHRIGYPVVVKPSRGAGCRGVRLVRHEQDLEAAIDAAHRANVTGLGRRSSKSEGGPLVMQGYVRGHAASVSLLADGRRAVPMAVNAQRVTAAAGFSYRGGATPFKHPLAEAAAAAASRTCEGIPGLRGYVGVDLVLTRSGPVVIEVNPRLTMSYLGLRAVLDENVAALALAACDGTLPPPPVLRRRVRFSAAGQVVSE
jgi:predicted ATP-grasp superfamily ATP-dependent carboligase